MQAQQFYEQSQQAEEQLAHLDGQIEQLTEFTGHLKFFEENPEQETFASLGKGVYFPAKIQDKKLLVNSGAGIFVEKTIAEARELVLSQIKQLHEFRVGLQRMLDGFAQELEKIAKNIEQERPSK